VHILTLVCYYLYLSHARLPANNNLWGVIVRRCCRSLMWVGGFALLLQHTGVVTQLAMGALIQRCHNLLSFFICRNGPSVWLGVCDAVGQHPLACDDRAIRCAREGAADIGEENSSRPAASTTVPQTLVRIGVEQWMTRRDILFTKTATYFIPDVYWLSFICW